MSYNPTYEASKSLPVDHVARKLDEFVAAGQDLSRRHFSRSPPPLPSAPSTEYEDSVPPSLDIQLHDQESKDLLNSSASAQFAIQIKDEISRMRAAGDRDLIQHPNTFDWADAAEANVKYRWMQQEIWDEQWAKKPVKTWKHESRDLAPPVIPSRSTNDGGSMRLETKRKRKHSDLQKEYQDLLRRDIDSQKRQMSRPCYQFVYQFCQEREWIKMGLSNDNEGQNADLDTRAYESLKARWIRDGIWDGDWTFIPGTSWRHERPRKYPYDSEYNRGVEARKAAMLEQQERPPHWYFLAPTFETEAKHPLTRNHNRASQSDSVEIVPDQSSRSVLKPTSKAMLLRRTQSTKAQESSPSPEQNVPRRNTRKSTVKAKPSTKGQENDKPRKRFPPKKLFVDPKRARSRGTNTQSLKISTPQRRSARQRPGENGAFVKKKENHDLPSVQVSSMSRPRRAAASKAMERLTNAKGS